VNWDTVTKHIIEAAVCEVRMSADQSNDGHNDGKEFGMLITLCSARGDAGKSEVASKIFACPIVARAFA